MLFNVVYNIFYSLAFCRNLILTIGQLSERCWNPYLYRHCLPPYKYGLWEDNYIFFILSLKYSPSFFTSTILCLSSFMLFGTFCFGSPSSNTISKTWPASILSSLSF